MNEHDKGLLKGIFITLVFCSILYTFIVFQFKQKCKQNCEIESITPIYPELKITVINGTHDTVFIYKQNNL